MLYGDDFPLCDLVPDWWWERLTARPPPKDRPDAVEIVPAGMRACMMVDGKISMQCARSQVPPEVVRCWDGPVWALGCLDVRGEEICVWQEPEATRAGYRPKDLEDIG